MRNAWKSTHDERYDNGNLVMLTHVWEYWIIYEPTGLKGIHLNFVAIRKSISDTRCVSLTKITRRQGG